MEPHPRQEKEKRVDADTPPSFSREHCRVNRLLLRWIEPVAKRGYYENHRR